jgi:hypothetical protein
MKQLGLLLLFASAARPVAAQQPACQAMRMGIFRMTSPNGVTTRISRSANRQTEQMSNSALQTDYTVEWLDACTYVLTPRASFVDKYPLAPRGARLTVHITKVTGNRYTTESTFNFSPDIIRSELVKVK